MRAGDLGFFLQTTLHVMCPKGEHLIWYHFPLGISWIHVIGFHKCQELSLLAELHSVLFQFPEAGCELETLTVSFNTSYFPQNITKRVRGKQSSTHKHRISLFLSFTFCLLFCQSYSWQLGFMKFHPGLCHIPHLILKPTTLEWLLMVQQSMNPNASYQQ